MSRISVSDAMAKCRMKIVKPARRRFWIMRWIDPATGGRKEQTTGTATKRRAIQIAAERARQIADGVHRDQFAFEEFSSRYRDEHLSSLSDKSRQAWRTTVHWLRKTEAPAAVNQIDAAFVVRWQNGLRQLGVSESSIAAYSARLRAALRWAAYVGIIAEAPEIRMPRKSRGKSKLARSRGITLEEFERILGKASKVRPNDAANWKRFLRGLWHSGFRLEELLRLSWSPGALWSIDASGELPCVRIRGTGEKAGRDRLQPITPEFWALCCKTPDGQRQGHVFPLPNGHGGQISVKRVGRLISKMGRAAGVITDPETGKCATSHDIGRRAFATRMEGTLSLAELQKWMRHASIDTTINYYHHAAAEELGRKVWGRGS